MKSIRLGVCAAIAATALLSACGSSEGSTNGDGDAKQGGTLTYMSSNLGPSIDPVGAIQLNGAAQSGYLFMAIYDALVIPTNDGYTPRLAESVESTDAIHWTMKLRPDVKFSDGTPFDAAAVKFTWERNDKAGTLGYNVMQNVASLTATDELTLEIVLKTPVSQFPRLIATNLNAIGSPTAFQKDPEGFATTPVGAGPFKVEKWVPDGELSLVRNDGYWNAPLPYLDKLVFKPVPDANQAFTALSTGDADAMFAFTYDIKAKADQAGYVVESWKPTIGSCVLFNTSSKPLDDLRVRQALVLAMDAQGESDTLEGGLAEVPTTLFTEDSPFYNESIALPQFDQAKAQELIDEVVAETGEPVKVTIAATPGPTQSIAEYFQSQMTAIKGLEVSIEVPDRETYIADIAAGKFQVFMYSINTMDPDPDLYTTLGAAAGNMVRADNPELEEALMLGRTSLDPTERQAAYDKAQQIIADQALGKFYGRKDYMTVYNGDRVGGIEVVGQGAPLFDNAFVK